MSARNINVGGLPLMAVQNTFLPKEGPKAIPLSLDYTGGVTEYDMSVSDLYQQGSGFPNISGLQTLYVDNKASTEPFIVFVSGSGQSLTIKAGAQGYFPIISPKNGSINFSGAGAIVRVILLNFPCSAAEWATA